MASEEKQIILDWYKDITSNSQVSPDHLTLLPSKLNKVVTDSRAISSGDFFIPIKGEKFDGHDYISDVLHKDALGALCENVRYSKLTEKEKSKAIPVKDSVEAYLKLAYHYRKSLKDTKLIAITGSNGKTTTKDLCYLALNSLYPTSKTEKNYNNEIGVAKTVLAIPKNQKFAIVEMGARHLQDIKKLVLNTDPDICCLLNIGNAHLGEFGSLENLYQAKLEMFHYAPKDSILIAPTFDEDIIDQVKNSKNPFVTFGLIDGDVYPSKIEKIDKENIQITFEIFNHSPVTLNLSYFHESLPINLASVFAILTALEVPLEKCLPNLSSYLPSEGRFQKIIGKNQTVIDDSYNANPASMKSGLSTLENLYSDKRKILILGDMLELGSETIMEHQKLGKYVNQLSKVSHVYTVGHYSKNLKNTLNPTIKYAHFNKVGDLIADFSEVLQYEDNPLIFLKGSNSIELFKLKEYWT